MPRPPLYVFAILFAAVFDWLCLRQLLLNPVDYPQFYFASELVNAGKVDQIYNTVAYEPLIASAGVTLGKVSVYFNRPPFSALLYAPLAWFSFRTGLWIFASVNVALWALLVWKLPVWLQVPTHFRVWLVCFQPFLFSVGICQDTLLLTLICAYACFGLMRRNEAAAGGLLAMGLFKPHLIFLLPVVLIVERRWRALTAFLITAGFLGALSLALIGVRGMEQWLLLLKAPTTDMVPELMGNLRALGIHYGPAAAVAAAIAATAAGCLVFSYGNYAERMSAALILALLVGPHTYVNDYCLLSIAALSTPSRMSRYAFIVPWIFFLPAANAMMAFVFIAIGSLLLMAGRYLPVTYASYRAVRYL
ncbi:MAG TPA: glycosyltransferase family 87 protein [Bryobacteraceae bacterium]|nr:glycosyltransferase family 87 protein [Bryobacteraceae bacterium]